MVRRKFFGIAVLLFTLGLSLYASSSVHGQSVAQGYGADTQISPGIIVKLKDKDATKVEPLTEATISKMYGVVVDANAVPVTLSSGITGPQVYVATDGKNNVLVSNQNGNIHTGDYITISSLDGTGMKANDHASFILGKASGNFDGKNGVLNTSTLKDSNGGQISVAIGLIPVVISVVHNPLLVTNQSNLPSFLRRASQSIANKPVSASRVYSGLVILVVSGLIAGSLLYAGIRSSFIAVGRNPLAKKTITHSLVQVMLTSLIVFIIGLFAVYLLLKL